MAEHSGDCPDCRTYEQRFGLPVLGRRTALASIGMGLFALAQNEAMAEVMPAASPDRWPPELVGGTRPRIYTRREWGAKAVKRPAKVIARMPDRIVVHHTATKNSTDYSLAHAYQLSRDIQRFHMHKRGWDDTGQQLTISRGGYVMEGRNRSLAAIRARRHVIGAQVRHHNEHTIGIENEGDYSQVPVPSALWSSLVRVCVWLCAEYRLDPYRAIVGHRDLGSTDCPGDVLYARLPELRTTAAALLGRPVRDVTAGTPSAPSGELGVSDVLPTWPAP